MLAYALAGTMGLGLCTGAWNLTAGASYSRGDNVPDSGVSTVTSVSRAEDNTAVSRAENTDTFRMEDSTATAWTPVENAPAQGADHVELYAAGPSDVIPERVPETEEERRDAEQLAGLIDNVTTVPETLESVAFTDMESFTRGRNLTVLGLAQTIAVIQNTDYDKLEQDLRDAINGISNAQEALRIGSRMSNEPIAGSVASMSMQNTYNSMYSQFEAIRNGDLQKSNADMIRQLQNASDQVVMGAETLYIALVAMNIQKGALERQLAALNRTVQEMETRYRLGQISALALSEVTSGRTALVSGLATLNSNLRIYKMQLENMLGASPTGEIRIGTLPTVTAEQIAAMNVETDLTAAKSRSYELLAAARTLETAEDTYKDSAKANYYDDTRSGYQNAVHTWTAAQYTYNSAVQSYELRFRTLYEQVHDYYQVWEAAKEALSAQQLSAQASELRYRQGNISQNTLFAARDELAAAEEKVSSAANDLFSSYNNYCWAVRHGILN